MTDPEITQDLSGVSPSAGTGAPAIAQDPAIAGGPVTVAPRRRRRRAVVPLAAVIALGLAAGLVVWAPWTPPPVLRPAGLAAVQSTVNSVAFRWSRPPSGPLPDKYLIMNDGSVAASVAGTANSYRQARLDPATSYQYGVVAVRGGKHSPRSALLALSTRTPPVAQARLQGPWDVEVKNVGPARGGRNGSVSWNFRPVCKAGACDVILRGQAGGASSSFKVKLTRTGRVYSGQAVTSAHPCGSGANSVPDPTTLKIRIRVTGAVGEYRVWAVSRWAGTMVGSYQYVSASTFYCPALTYRTSLTGSPA
jgi:hypothetical protein